MSAEEARELDRRVLVALGLGEPEWLQGDDWRSLDPVLARLGVANAGYARKIERAWELVGLLTDWGFEVEILTLRPAPDRPREAVCRVRDGFAVWISEVAEMPEAITRCFLGVWVDTGGESGPVCARWPEVNAAGEVPDEVEYRV